MSQRSSMPSGNSYELVHYVPAIILYPALLTPAILVGDQDLEILLVGKDNQPIREVNIANQLKIDNQLHHRKRYQEEYLPSDWITIDSESTLSEGIIKTHSEFAGLLDSRSLSLFRKQGYTKLYSVRINNRGIFRADRGTLYNLMWVHYGDVTSRPVGQTDQSAGFPMPGSSSPTMNPIDRSEPGQTKVIANELQDHIIWNVLNEMNGSNIPEQGKYCFVNGIPDAIDQSDPIQAYHPVFYYDSLTYANIAHIADIHLCSRQYLMSQSKARVIESDGDLGISPEIGSMLNINSERLRQLFTSFGGDDSVQLLLITGDMVDYIKSLYVTNLSRARNARQIWDAIALDDNYENNYQDFVDFISFYSLLVDFYRRAGKPAFAVSGNHDAYYWPYGISPRVTFLWIRANEGIPADHNLTLYEAILAFGETYHEVRAPGVRHWNLLPEQLAWFYTVFTPFSDFAVYLPNQCLVGLAWGEDEDLLDIGEQGFGHLPRSDDAISDKQKSLFDDVQRNKGNRKVILASHFTFASYADNIPMYPQHEGDVEFDIGWDACEYDMGTFETNRKAFYEQHFAQQRGVQCALTGHSHRRGLYNIDRADYWGDNSVKTNFYELHRFTAIDPGKREPAIIVSDSAGPYPRRNKVGEFFGWGSDRPSGAKLVFDSNGSIRSINVIQAGRSPRFVIALDYMDLIHEERVIRQFRCDQFRNGDEVSGLIGSYDFHLVLHSHVEDLAYVNRILLYAKPLGQTNWYRLQMGYDRGSNRWKISDVSTFRRFFTRNTGKTFMAMRFSMKPDRADRLAQYDFGSYWCFQVEIEPEYPFSLRGSANRPKYYEIRRDEESAEIPDFEWRRNEFSKYQ